MINFNIPPPILSKQPPLDEEGNEVEFDLEQYKKNYPFPNMVLLKLKLPLKIKLLKL